MINREKKENGIQFIGQNTIQISSALGTGGAYGKFNYDQVFDEASNNGEIYELAVKPIVTSVMQGFNGTVFAYG